MAKVRIGGRASVGNSSSQSIYTIRRRQRLSQNAYTIPQSANPLPQTNPQSQNQPLPNNQNVNQNVQQMANDYNTLKAQSKHNLSQGFLNGQGIAIPGYNDNNNPNLLAYQGLHGAPFGNYANAVIQAKVPYADADGYTYHQSNFQNAVIDLNLNSPIYATLNSKDFDAYCKATGQDSFFRGWSGSNSKKRFISGNFSHTGCGMYGEGYYFGDRGVAQSYSRGAITECALSPNARVVSLSYIQSKIASSPHKRIYNNLGKTPSSGFSDNMGESFMALKLGYNVIQTSWSYIVLTRDAVVLKKG